MKLIPYCFFFVSIFANAQETKYKQALDSIDYYLKFTKLERQTKLVSYYHPNTYSNMSENSDSLIYLQMAFNYKTKIVLTDGDMVYMIDFKQIDTTCFGIGRKGLKIMDPSKKVMFRMSNSARLFNGKIRGVEIDQIDLIYPYSDDEHTYLSTNNIYNLKKLIYFFKQATIYSKKVKTKKKDIWLAEGYA